MRVNNKKIMEKFTKSKLVAQIAITSFVAALAIVGIAYATTIGTNISTGGTLSVSLSSTMATTTISGGDLIVDTDTLVVDNDNNRVGVGTTTPGYLLDVDGDLRVGEIGNANALVIDAGTGAIVINDDGAATADIRAEGDTVTDLFFLDASADRVGVGTTTPGYLLDVDGDLRVGIAGKANTFYVDSTNGRIGIGTSTPSATLSVTGTDAGGQLMIGYDATNYTTLTISAGGDLTITPSGGDISLAGNSAVTGTLSVTGATSLSTASSTGGVKFPSIDSDTGAIGIGTSTPGSYLLDVDGDVRIGESGNANALTIDAGTGAIVINDDGAATADVRVEGNTKTDLFMIDASADRVGIGSTTPSALFSVGETGSVSSATTTIDFAKPCFRMMTEDGTMLYLYLKLNANAYSNWATSTNSCF